MVEMRPGIGIDQFVAGFVRESKARVHPWVAEYDRTARAEPDAEREAERQVLAALRVMATVELHLEYDLARHALTVAKTPARSLTLLGGERTAGLMFECAPLLLTERPGAWTRLERLAESSLRFENVPMDKVTAFVALRARCKTPPRRAHPLGAGAPEDAGGRARRARPGCAAGHHGDRRPGRGAGSPGAGPGAPAGGRRCPEVRHSSRPLGATPPQRHEP